MNEEQLKEFVQDGKSIQDIATHYGKSKTSIRHWLSKYGLTTTGKAGAKHVEIVDDCKKCAKCLRLVPIRFFGLRKDRESKPRSYCLECEAQTAKLDENSYKDAAISYCGSKCAICDINGDRRIFDFHHKEPEHKDFNISEYKSYPFKRIIKELDKCALLCSNCHQEVHHEMKKRDGYINKIKGNTELAAANKLRKINAIGEPKCSQCGYNNFIGSLVIKFREGMEHLRKYNKTHWDDSFTCELKLAKIICKNCNRLN